MGKMFEDVRFEPTEESNMLFLAAGWPTGASEEERLFGVPTDCKVMSIKFVILPDNCIAPIMTLLVVQKKVQDGRCNLV